MDVLILAAVRWPASPAAAGVFDRLLEGIGAGARRGLDSDTVAAGLREALAFGARRAVEIAAAQDGFPGDENRRIHLPGVPGTPATALRAAAHASQVEALEVAMNRAAERAAASSLDVRIDAVSRMTFEEARNILPGGETAATDTLCRTSWGALAERFRPVVRERMRQVGVFACAGERIDRASAIPFVTVPQSLSLGNTTLRLR